MGFKNFRFNCAFRVLFLCGTFYAVIYMIQHTKLYALIIAIGVLFIYQIFSLIQYVEATNRSLAAFLQSIAYSDFTQNFRSRQRGSAFTELNDAFNDVLKKIQQSRIEKAEQYSYLQTVVQNIGIGLIIFKNNEHRSEKLLQFVENYRKLNRIPKPNFEIFPVCQLFEQVIPLYQNLQVENPVQITYTIQPQDIELTADQSLIEQVLINLIKNAIEACTPHGGTINIDAGLNHIGRPFIKVTDNGPGIESNALLNIFIPFFTTKAQGSGIGLSLSRQIMRLHNGNLIVQSKPDNLTTFSMIF